MAAIPPPKRTRESDDEDDAHDQVVDPASESLALVMRRLRFH